MNKRLFIISRTIFIVSITLFIISGVVLLLQGMKSITLIGVLFSVGGLLLCVNFMIPGLLIIFKLPWLAYAWLQGRNPIVYSNGPWDELPKNRRSLIYTDSIFWLLVVIVFLIWLVTSNF